MSGPLRALANREDFFNLVSTIMQKLRYPIHDYPSLVNAVGEQISIGNHRIALEDLRMLAESTGGTNDFMPIIDANDFASKAQKFYDRVMQQPNPQ